MPETHYNRRSTDEHLEAFKLTLNEHKYVITQNRRQLDELAEGVKEINVKTDQTHQILITHVSREDEDRQILERIKGLMDGLGWITIGAKWIRNAFLMIVGFGAIIAGAFEYLEHLKGK